MLNLNAIDFWENYKNATQKFQYAKNAIGSNVNAQNATTYSISKIALPLNLRIFLQTHYKNG